MLRSFVLILVAGVSCAIAEADVEFYGRTLTLFDDAGEVDDKGMVFGIYGIMRADWGKWSEETELGDNEFAWGWALDCSFGIGKSDDATPADLTLSVPFGLTGRYHFGGENEIGFYYIPADLYVFVPAGIFGSRFVFNYERPNLRASFSRFAQGIGYGCFVPTAAIKAFYLGSVQYVFKSHFSIGAKYGFGSGFEEGTGNTIMGFVGFVQ